MVSYLANFHQNFNLIIEKPSLGSLPSEDSEATADKLNRRNRFFDQVECQPKLDYSS